jgi:hypothetical protein
MPIRPLPASALTLALLAAGAAPAAAEIVPQESIAGVRLKMSKAEVAAVLGQPARKRRYVGGSGADDHFATWTYKRRGYAVSFLRRGTYRVSSITVTGGSERTATGVGIGSTRAEVKAGVPAVHCKRYDPTYATCFIGKSRIGDITTAFRLDRRNRVKEISLAKILYD